MKILFVPAVAWCVSTSCFAVTEDAVLPPTLVPVATEVAESPPEKGARPGPGARLDGLRKLHGGLAESLEETGKAVEEMARQRDLAREQAKQSGEAQRMAMEEAAALRKQLAEARKGEREWKSKSEKVAVAAQMAEVQKVGAELRRELKNVQGRVETMEKEAEKPHQALKRSEESRRKAMAQVKAANAAAGKIKAEMALLKKAKVGLEELLFRKTDEVRELKAKLKK